MTTTKRRMQTIPVRKIEEIHARMMAMQPATPTELSVKAAVLELEEADAHMTAQGYSTAEICEMLMKELGVKKASTMRSYLQEARRTWAKGREDKGSDMVDTAPAEETGSTADPIAVMAARDSSTTRGRSGASGDGRAETDDGSSNGTPAGQVVAEDALSSAAAPTREEATLEDLMDDLEINAVDEPKAARGSSSDFVEEPGGLNSGVENSPGAQWIGNEDASEMSVLDENGAALDDNENGSMSHTGTDADQTGKARS